MTTNFEQAYDATRVAVAALLTGKTELPNPYALDTQAIGQLANGWGITVGQSAVGPASFNTTNDRTVVGIVLTREVVATEADGAAQHLAVKALKADATSLYKRLEGGNVLSLPNVVDNVVYAGTSEVLTGQGERHRWISLTVSFVIWTTETLG